MVNIMPTAAEAFPLLASPASDSFTVLAGPKTSSNDIPRRRRKSSGLGGPKKVFGAGNTSSAAFATFPPHPPSPATLKAQREDGKTPFSKRKFKTIYKQWKRYSAKHTWVIPLILLGIILSLYLVYPTRSNPIYGFIFLSYEIPLEPGSTGPTQYGKGLWDVAFVTFYVIVLSFTREFIMQIFLRPLARSHGIRSRAKQSRFMEQFYTALYFAFSGTWGIYIMRRTPMWYFDTRGMYEGFPHKTHEAVFKFYYLFQAAYWYQQAVVMILGMEAKRKDFLELVGHHIITLSLIGLSYGFHFTYMGLAVFVTHDVSDFFFASLKVLNYIDHPLVAPYFVLFFVMWIYLRHYLNLKILYSEFNEFKTVGPYGLDWAAGQFKCDLSHYISTALLAALQSLNLFWLKHIVRVAYQFAFYNRHEDDRSENEEEELAEEKRQDDLDAQREKNLDALMNGVVTNGKANGSGIHANGATKRR